MQKRSTRFIAAHGILILLLTLSACSTARKKQEPPVPGPETKTDTIPYNIYPSPVQALKTILEDAKPAVIGFGEYHQQKETADISSSLKRFTDSLVPVLAEVTSDLIVETWITEGECGEAEEEVVSDVAETTERPETTEDEVVTLIKKAHKLGIQPHVLEMTCDDYRKLQQSDGEVDYNGLMELIARRMEEKCSTILDSRTLERKLIAIYGGALHNDIHPDEEWKAASFGPRVQEMARGRYVEIDMFVPEFIEADEDIQKENWFPIFRRNPFSDKVLLMRPGKSRYVIVLRKGFKD
jgi:hypothetical protein